MQHITDYSMDNRTIQHTQGIIKQDKQHYDMNYVTSQHDTPITS